MYKNIGIDPEQQDCCKIADKYWASNTESGFEYLMQKECPYNQECTDECEYAYDKVVYPPFTAEKQLELIKWFIHSRHFSSTRFNARWVVDNIASYTNYIWKDLTEKERKQIKEILE